MKKFTADFETTTDPQDCRVWAYAICEIGDPNNFIYGNSIDDFMEWCSDPKNNTDVYFHNLKFDGEFILNWLFKNGFNFIEDKKERKDKTFTTLIGNMGQFYSIEVYFKIKGHHTNKIRFLDSLKILNFSVENIAKDFDLPLRKLKLDYTTYREPGHKLTSHEIDYIRGDVEIMSRALDIMFNQNLKKMTIGSDALNYYKEMVGFDFNRNFPELSLEIDGFLRESYKGGFTYLSDKYVGKETGAGIVFDKNSMYPSMMKYEKLPFGYPLKYKGKYQENKKYDLFIQRLQCSFDLKEGKIPCIQMKHTSIFAPNEYLKSSGGEILELVLTSVDLKLFLENYNVEELEYIDGFMFQSKIGMFSDYIDYWTNKKIEAKKEKNNSMYRISKLMLNSLYGKFGTNPISRKKLPYYENGQVKYKFSDYEQQNPLYVAVASFITAYARSDIIHSSEIIREYSLRKYGFDAYVYSDTDSIHCLLGDADIEELSLFMKIDDYKLGYWKLESRFEKGKYIRQKCYIEQFDGKLNTTVAGLPKRLGKYLNFDNFNIGFTTEGLHIDNPKLVYNHTKGGVVLTPTDFTIK